MRAVTGNIIKRMTDVFIWLFLIALLLEAGDTCKERKHGYVFTECKIYTESNRRLNNPNRGFYSMYGFLIEQSEQEFSQLLEKKMQGDKNTISLIQINLKNFQHESITEQGLKNIRTLFHDLEAKGKQYIIRFLYDWNGKAEETEPEDIQIIVKHMNQIKDILSDYSHIIFTFQGIFVGDCGEMHDSIHMSEEGMILLMKQFYQNSPENTYLSVRTPQQWRILANAFQTEEMSGLCERLGLYNDGILGTSLDTGTYGTESKEKVGMTGKWNREEELEFQSELCKKVPNGGEVIIENNRNDFENAIQALKTMHVTYLNKDYDRNVLKKWAESTVNEEGCFYGMDGLTYVERHLGYRLFIADADLNYNVLDDHLTVIVKMQNAGFAPLYKEPETKITIRNKKSHEEWEYLLATELRTLAGGKESEKLLNITEKISLEALEEGTYEVFFSIKDKDSNRMIELANEQKPYKCGYKLGELQVDAMPDLKELMQK